MSVFWMDHKHVFCFLLHEVHKFKTMLSSLLQDRCQVHLYFKEQCESHRCYRMPGCRLHLWIPYWWRRWSGVSKLTINSLTPHLYHLNLENIGQDFNLCLDVKCKLTINSLTPHLYHLNLENIGQDFNLCLNVKCKLF